MRGPFIKYRLALAVSHFLMHVKERYNMSKRILVIDSTGLLGEPVATHLKENSFIVRLMVRNIEKASERFGNEFEIAEGNINKLKELISNML